MPFICNIFVDDVVLKPKAIEGTFQNKKLILVDFFIVPVTNMHLEASYQLLKMEIASLYLIVKFQDIPIYEIDHADLNTSNNVCWELTTREELAVKFYIVPTPTV